ncbi:MAG: response regulator transcription factor KdpE [Ruminiclostridium sp.]
MEEKACILYGKNQFTALRLENLFQNKGFKFLYSKSILSLKDNIALAQKNLLCIFVEIDNEDESIGLIEDAKASAADVPLIVLSDNPRRYLFVKAILAGATDFIVKPFEESLLLERISKLLLSLPESVFNYNDAALELIRIELSKSQKGNHPLGFALITFFKPVDRYNAKLEQRYRKDLPQVFSDIGKSLFEKDVKQLIGAQSMLVVLTFSHNEQISSIENKLTELYKQLKIHYSSFNEYLMAQVFVSKFEDTFEPVDILNLLINGTKKIIADKKGRL